MKKLLTGILAIVIGVFALSAPAIIVPSTPVSAAVVKSCEDLNNSNRTCVSTTVLGSKYDRNGKKEGRSGYIDSDDNITCSCDDGEGSGIMHIVNLVVEIMTIGVGILGVLGITIVGIQYLTAGGSEEQTRRAKRRMFEIVIGIVAYVVIYALLNWLIPGFDPF